MIKVSQDPEVVSLVNEEDFVGQSVRVWFGEDIDHIESIATALVVEIDDEAPKGRPGEERSLKIFEDLALKDIELCQVIDIV